MHTWDVFSKTWPTNSPSCWPLIVGFTPEGSQSAFVSADTQPHLSLFPGRADREHPVQSLLPAGCCPGSSVGKRTFISSSSSSSSSAWGMAWAYLPHSSFKVRAQQLCSGRDPHALPNNARLQRPHTWTHWRSYSNSSSRGRRSSSLRFRCFSCRRLCSLTEFSVFYSFIGV